MTLKINLETMTLSFYTYYLEPNMNANYYFVDITETIGDIYRYIKDMIKR